MLSPEMVKASAHASPTHWFAILRPSMTKPRISILSKFASWNAVRSSPFANSTKYPEFKNNSISVRTSVSQRMRGSLESRYRKGWLLPLPSKRRALISSGKKHVKERVFAGCIGKMPSDAKTEPDFVAAEIVYFDDEVPIGARDRCKLKEFVLHVPIAVSPLRVEIRRLFSRQQSFPTIFHASGLSASKLSCQTSADTERVQLRHT